MATATDLRRQIPHAQVIRLKEMFEGLKVDRVHGRRLLVATIKPRTAADKAHESWGFVTPDSAEANVTPRPTTGQVLQHGNEMTAADKELFPIGCAVMYGPFGGQDITILSKHLKILDLNEIFCTLWTEEDGGMMHAVRPTVEEKALEIKAIAG